MPEWLACICNGGFHKHKYIKILSVNTNNAYFVI